MIFLFMIWKYLNGLFMVMNWLMFIYVKCNIDDVVNKQFNMNSVWLVIVFLINVIFSSLWIMEGVIMSRFI